MTVFSKRSLEGCLLIDHRAGDGTTTTIKDTVPVGRGTMFESPTITCAHCQRIVVLNPDRSRSRGYCPNCDGYVCDECEAVRVSTGECRSFERFADDYLNRAAKGLPLPELKSHG